MILLTDSEFDRIKYYEPIQSTGNIRLHLNGHLSSLEYKPTFGMLFLNLLVILKYLQDEL